MSMFTQGDDFYDMGYAKGRADSAKEYAEDVRELVEALETLYRYEAQRSCEDTRWESTMMTKARAALTKHREQS